MRLYDRRSIRTAGERAADRRTESMDGICWEVLTAERMARVKIQGSNEYVLARWPANWQTMPPWLRPGQSVRLVHREGLRGLLEVTGFGLTIPTPVAGAATPSAETPLDAIISGLKLYQRPYGPTLLVWMSMGTARFSGVTINSLPEATTADITAADGLKLGQVSGAWIITPPAAGQYRLAYFTINAAGTVTKREGSTFTTTPLYPTIPAGELTAAVLFIRGGMTEITTADIAQAWKPPTASILDIVTEDVTEAPATQQAYTLTVNVKDQYGNPITNIYGWRIKMKLQDGDGTLTNAAGQSGATVETLTYSSSAVFNYIKGPAAGYAMFEANLNNGQQNIQGSVFVVITQA